MPCLPIKRLARVPTVTNEPRMTLSATHSPKAIIHTTYVQFLLDKPVNACRTYSSRRPTEMLSGHTMLSILVLACTLCSHEPVKAWRQTVCTS